MLDILIIGAGPAGMSAAIYALRAGKRVAVFDKAMYGGQTVNTYEIENYPGIRRISGTDFAMQLYEQAAALGAQFVFADVAPLCLEGKEKKLMAGEQEYTAKAVIIANGAARRKLECNGEQRLTGRGVSYCATCDGAFFKGKQAIVAGSGNTALEDALYLANICAEVRLLIRGDRRPEASGAPSSITWQVSTPSFTPTGASSSLNSTPSSRANSSSSWSAGM